MTTATTTTGATTTTRVTTTTTTTRATTTTTRAMATTTTATTMGTTGICLAPVACSPPITLTRGCVTNRPLVAGQVFVSEAFYEGEPGLLNPGSFLCP